MVSSERVDCRLVAARYCDMARLVIVVAAFLLVGVALACSADRSGQEQAVEVRLTPTRTPTVTLEVRLTPTTTPTATVEPTPAWDVMTQCGPPLSERYCELEWRPPPPSCPVSRPVTIRSGMEGIGGPLVWQVGPHVSFFEPERDHLYKTIWIVAEGIVDQVRITGQRLDGPGTITFPRYDRDASFPENALGRTELVLKPPYGLSDDHRTAIDYPSAGCWQFTAQVGTWTVEIVQYLYEEPP